MAAQHSHRFLAILTFTCSEAEYQRLRTLNANQSVTATLQEEARLLMSGAPAEDPGAEPSYTDWDVAILYAVEVRLQDIPVVFFPRTHGRAFVLVASIALTARHSQELAQFNATPATGIRDILCLLVPGARWETQAEWAVQADVYTLLPLASPSP